MTRKELNVIRHAAYMAWAETSDAKDLFNGSREYFACWKVTEHIAGQFLTKHVITECDSQINNETLKSMGFTPDAKCKKIFEVDRKSRTLTPAGWD